MRKILIYSFLSFCFAFSVQAQKAEPRDVYRSKGYYNIPKYYYYSMITAKQDLLIKHIHPEGVDWIVRKERLNVGKLMGADYKAYMDIF